MVISRVKIIVLSAVVVLGLLGFWAFTHSFIVIEVESAEAGDVSYSLTSGVTNAEPKNTSSKSIKKLVSRGEKQLVVTQGGSSYVAVVKAKGFLTTTKVAAKLVEESERAFVGNKPSGCIYFVSQVLLSSACGDSVNSLKVHVPATASLPTYTRNASNVFTGFVEGVIYSSDLTKVLVEAPPRDEDQGAPHTLFNLSSTGGVSGGVALDGLRDNETYKAVNYKDGFLAYSPSGHAVEYNIDGSGGEEVDLGSSKNTSLKLHSVSARNDVIFQIFKQGSPRMNPDIIDLVGEQAHSELIQSKLSSESGGELVVQEGDSIKHFTFDQGDLSICGSNACNLQDGKLDVYGIGGSRLKLLYSVYGVNKVVSKGAEVYLATSYGIIKFDVDKRSGYLVYSFGGYNYCGLNADSLSLLVCIDNNGDRSVLALSDKPVSEEPIDEKVYKLSKSPNVKSVSAYGNFIFVSPDVSAAPLVQGSVGMKYDPQVIGSINTQISKSIKDLGFNPSYTIINTLASVGSN